MRRLCVECRETDPAKFYKRGKTQKKCITCHRRKYRETTMRKRLDLEFRKKQAAQIHYGTE